MLKDDSSPMEDKKTILLRLLGWLSSFEIPKQQEKVDENNTQSGTTLTCVNQHLYQGAGVVAEGDPHGPITP